MRTSASLSNAIEQRETKGRSWKSRVLRRGFLTSSDLARLKSFVEFAMWKPKKNLGLAFYDRFPFVQLIIVWIGYHKTSQRNVKTFREIFQDIPHVHNDESRAQHKIKVALVTVFVCCLWALSLFRWLPCLPIQSNMKNSHVIFAHCWICVFLSLAVLCLIIQAPHSFTIVSRLVALACSLSKKKHSVNAVVVIAKLLSKLQSTFFVFSTRKKKRFERETKAASGIICIAWEELA